MNSISVQLPANRDYTGQLEIRNAAGKRIAGPFRVCGRVDDQSAQNNKNPMRDPLLPFGDIPFGEYQVVKILPSGPGTAYSADEFGAAGIVLLRPKLGDAALADANGRFGFFIQGGTRGKGGLLRPTRDGSLRLSDQDQRRFIRELQKLGEGGAFCLVVCTAKLGAKAAGLTPAATPRRKASASLLLAGSVAASAITGTIRQALVRSAIHAAGATITASGVVLLMENHASAQDGGDGAYGHPPDAAYPTAQDGQNAMDQGNTVNENSQNATHAVTDEQAHHDAGNGFDTPAATPPPVDLHDKQGIVDPNAASGGLPPASDAGTVPGSPISLPPQPQPTTEEPPAATTEEMPATQSTVPDNQTMPEQTAPVENAVQTPPTTPETETPMAPSQPAEAPAVSGTVPENQVIPTVENSQTAPAPTTVPESSVANPTVVPMMAAPSEPAAAITPPAQEPASQAITEHDVANPQLTPQPGPAPQAEPTPAPQPDQTTSSQSGTMTDQINTVISSFSSANPDADGKAYTTKGGGSRTAEEQVAIILDPKNDANYPNIKESFKDKFGLDTLPSYDNLTADQKDWFVSAVNAQAGKPNGFAHVGGNAQDVSVKNLTVEQKNALHDKLTEAGYGVLNEKYSKGKSTYGVDIGDANLFHVYKK